MIPATRTSILGIALLAGLVLLTRLPFLGAGYGLHADNWRIALAARHVAETGVYEASRFPGYPVQEYVCSWFWKTGPLGLNALDAFFCVLAVAWFALIFREYGCRDWWLAALALAFVPIVYINSVASKDFVWALAFLLGSWWCAMRSYPLRAGLLLGLAMGCRITSGAAALPITLLLVEDLPNREALRSVFRAGVAAGCVAFAAYLPVYWRYGTEFFTFYADHGFPDALSLAARATIEVWGILGLAGLVLALASAPAARGSRPEISRRHLLAWTLMVVIYLCAFLSLPDEVAYLIPAVPFILLLAWYAAAPIFFRIACVLILLSPWIGWRGGPAAGDIIQDHRDRVSTLQQINGFLHFSTTVSGSNAYITGSWAPPLAVLTADHPPAAAKFLYLVTQGELAELQAKGWHVWYLPLMREFDARVNAFDVAAHGARDVRELRPDPRP